MSHFNKATSWAKIMLSSCYRTVNNLLTDNLKREKKSKFCFESAAPFRIEFILIGWKSHKMPVKQV